MPDTIDQLIVGFDRALRTLSGTASAARPNPAGAIAGDDLTPEERRHAAGLMRVNHTGEVCAQALYQAQALVARDPEVKQCFAAAAREEEDHLAWTQERLSELGDRTSLANPIWYAGSFAIGLAAGLAGRPQQSRLRRRDRAPGRGASVLAHRSPAGRRFAKPRDRRRNARRRDPAWHGRERRRRARASAAGSRIDARDRKADDVHRLSHLNRIASPLRYTSVICFAGGKTW